MTVKHIMLLTDQIGLSRPPAFYRDANFVLALAMGALVLFVMWLWLVQGLQLQKVLTPDLIISLVIWQPLIEELLFRGIIQGQFYRSAWAKVNVLGLSRANVLTSVIFVAFHLVYHAPLWALSIFIPSLVFGYFRDRYQNIYPGIIIHSIYNLGFLVIIYI